MRLRSTDGGPRPGARTDVGAGMHAWWPMTAVVAFSAGVVALGFCPGPGLGDASESVSGAMEWRVVHAPGYVWHIGSVKAFGTVVPVGSWAFRANLFSALVTVVASVGVYQIGLRVGARPIAAIAASWAWVSTTSVWFYAAYAKHDALTSAWLVLIVWVMSGAWRGPSPRRILVVGVLVGTSLGVGWPVIVSSALGVLVWLNVPGRRVRNGLMVTAGALAGGVVTGATVLWRAATQPESFGGVDSLPRLWRLWSLADFGTGADPSRPAGGHGGWGPVGEVARYGAVLARDIGPLVAFVGVAGIVLLWLGRSGAGPILTAVAAGNLVAVVVVLDIQVWGFRSGIVQGGFLAPLILVTTIGVAATFNRLVDALAERGATPLAWAAVVVLVAPGVLTHRAPATQLRAPVTFSYGRQVLTPLPRGSVLLTGTLSSSFPIRLAQDEGVRRDVLVVSIDGLATDWYRDQATDLLDIELSPVDRRGSLGVALDLIAGHPDTTFHLDAEAQDLLAPTVSYRPTGLTAELTTETNPGYQRPEQPSAQVDLIEQLAAEAGIDTDPSRGRWPNDDITRAYARPLLLIAQDAINQQDPRLAKRALAVASRLEPDNDAIADALAMLGPD